LCNIGSGKCLTAVGNQDGANILQENCKYSTTLVFQLADVAAEVPTQAQALSQPVAPLPASSIHAQVKAHTVDTCANS